MISQQDAARRRSVAEYHLRRPVQIAPRHPGGWTNYRGRFFGRFYEAFLILHGTHSLHRAWQRGYDQHIRDESARRARGGK